MAELSARLMTGGPLFAVVDMEKMSGIRNVSFRLLEREAGTTSLILGNDGKDG